MLPAARLSALPLPLTVLLLERREKREQAEGGEGENRVVNPPPHTHAHTVAKDLRCYPFIENPLSSYSRMLLSENISVTEDPLRPGSVCVLRAPQPANQH